MKEVYRTIKEFNGRYQVSNFGNVYSARKKDLLKPYKFIENGQVYVRLHLKGERGKHVQVGKLVLQYFRPSQIPLKCVLHFDLNKENNISNNLAYGTRSDLLREGHRRRNKIRGVYAYKKSQTGVMLYRACLKIDNKIITLGYSRKKEDCAKMYIRAYVAAYGVLPYVD